MEEKVDIVALGELLIDFTEAGHSSGWEKIVRTESRRCSGKSSNRCKPLWVSHIFFNQI